MKRILIVTFFVSTAFGMQKQQELSSTLMQLDQQLQDLENALKKTKQIPSFDIFQQLASFSRLLDDFSKIPSEDRLDQLIEMIFHELLFENLEDLDLQKLRKLRNMLSDIDEKIVRINQNMKNRGVNSSIQEEFHETVYMTFKDQKELIEPYINQKNREFQQTLFDQSVTNARNQFIKFQNEPTVLTLSRLANALKFNIQFLDVVDQPGVISQIFINFNQLVKDIENAFYYPNKALQDLAKKTGRKAWIKKYSKEILDTLHETQVKLRKYLKNRLEAARKEKK